MVVVVFLAFVLLAAGGGYMAWARWNSARTDPTKVSLPAPEKADATKAYMGGPGKPLHRFLAATDALPATASMVRCTQLATGTLAKFPPPPRLAGLASAVPDPTLADALGNHIDAVVDYLETCARGEDLAKVARGTHFTAVVATRQLKKVDT